MIMNKDIIFLTPVCTHNIWGGTRLNREFGYPIEGDDIGECWGISAHPNGDGTVASGAYKGMKLSELWEKHPELFGDTGMDRFPLLIKIIDAKNSGCGLRVLSGIDCIKKWKDSVGVVSFGVYGFNRF
jgi:beta-glucosidase